MSWLKIARQSNTAEILSFADTIEKRLMGFSTLLETHLFRKTRRVEQSDHDD